MHSRHTSSRRSRNQLAGGLIAALATASLVASMQPAPGQAAKLTPDRNERVHGEAAGPLAAKSGASALSTVKGYLRSQGRDAATISSLKPDGDTWTFRGVTHLRVEQRVSGMRVYGAYAKAAFDAKGRLIHLIENVSPVGTSIRTSAKDEAAALRAAVKDLYPKRSVSTTTTDRTSTKTTFAAGRFLTGPRVERVLVPTRAGGLAVGYEVETWDAASNDLYLTLVSGDGSVVSHELRTAQHDEYNVFTNSPERTPQTVVAGPGDGNAQSPIGWLAPGAHRSIDLSGNNAHAYLDAVSDNKPDSGGDVVTDGHFLTEADLTESPSTEDNQEVAVQNLFYLNNVIHDTLYDAGFVEAAGNFQEDNLFNGGKDSDSVNAEAQDGGGIDNANFATPPDGVNPRMQMYLWTGLGTHEVVVHEAGGDVTYLAQGAVWGAQLDSTGVTGDLAVANDGTATTSDACEPLVGTYTGAVVVADRGNCDFTAKAGNVQRAGGAALVVANNVAGSPFSMGGADGSVTIGAVMVSQSDGTAIKGASGTSATVKLADTPPLMRDGDLDSDIVWHEYGHGLTWRMIGKMRGPLAGAIGEGMSDVLALIANEDDAVAEYSASDPLGIRSATYDTYPRTYGDVAGTSVHFDGEVYGAIGWRMLESYQGAGIDKSVLLADLVDGMNYTPRAPSYEEMRDGILAGLAATGNDARACLVWDAFAEYGVGVGAVGIAKGPNVSITESFALPVECA